MPLKLPNSPARNFPLAIFFISDLHLRPDRTDLVAALQAFVGSTLTQGDRLYILGDFFDAWIGDDEDLPFYTEIKSQLRAWVERGIAVFFMHGNRDFLVANKFADDTGVQLISDPTVLVVNQQTLLLMHGDSLCTRDEAYIAFRKQVRSTPWQQQVLSLPLVQRRVMAAELRSKSQSMNSNKAEDIMDVTDSEVIKAMARNNANILIHGHTHRPARHPLDVDGQKVERIVLGDWDRQGWYLKIDSDDTQNTVTDNAELNHFDIA